MNEYRQWKSEKSNWFDMYKKNELNLWYYYDVLNKVNIKKKVLPRKCQHIGSRHDEIDEGRMSLECRIYVGLSVCQAQVTVFGLGT